MKEMVKANTGWSTMKRFALCVGCGLFLGFMFTAMARCETFSKMAAEAQETGSVVVWYVQNGYWREDVKAYLTHAENVLYPQSGAGARISLEEGE